MALSDITLTRAETYWRMRYASTHAGLSRIKSTGRNGLRPLDISHWIARKGLEHSIAYRRFPQYKETNRQSQAEYRQSFAWSPLTALVEAAAMADLSKNLPNDSSSCVYSYQLSRPRTRHAFEYFVDGYDRRVHEITSLLQANDDLVAVVADVRNFYPSISKERARLSIATVANLSPVTSTFLDQFLKMDCAGLPIGPALSHVLANAVLKSMDHALSNRFPSRYFRYVDDIVIVTRRADADDTQVIIRSELEKLDLQSYPAKEAILSRDVWLKNAPLLAERVTWNGNSVEFDDLLGAVRTAIATGVQPMQIQSSLRSIGVRLPRYVFRPNREESAFDRVKGILRGGLQRLLASSMGSQRISIQNVLSLASLLRREYERRLQAIQNERQDDLPVLRRWQIQRALRLAHKLLMLRPAEAIGDLASMLPEGDGTLPFRRILSSLMEQRPGLMLPYPGGPVRQLSFFWNLYGYPTHDSSFTVKTVPFFESALEMVVRGVISPETVKFDELDGEHVRLAVAMLRNNHRRAVPDLSFEDEIESLFLQTPVGRRFRRLETTARIDAYDP